MSEVPIRVWSVGRSSESQYLVVLRDDSNAFLPMTIGPCEAVAIWSIWGSDRELDPPSEELTRRPGAHDLLCSLLEKLGAKLVKVVIDDLWNQVYFAKLHLAVNGQTLTIDARPSDSIAIALRLEAPLYVVDAVMAAAAQDEGAPGPAPDEQGPDQELEDL